jgi:hypothetical protein
VSDAISDNRASAAFQDDVAAILVALGLGDHARPMSAHSVVSEEIIPAIARLRASRSVSPDYDKLLDEYGGAMYWQGARQGNNKRIDDARQSLVDYVAKLEAEIEQLRGDPS